MKPSSTVTSAATTVLVTVLLAAIAYASTTGGLHRFRSAQSVATPQATPSPKARTKPPPVIPTPPPVIPTPPRTASGLPVIDADFADPSDGWLLLTTCVEPAPTPECHYSTASTADGGATWSHPVQVGPSFAPDNGDGPRSIRFLDLKTGWVYGHSVAYVTRDGGKTWAGAGLKATEVSQILISGGVVWAVTYPCAKGTICQYNVSSSTDGGRTWLVRPLPASFSPAAASAFPSGLLLTGNGPGDGLVTYDLGVHWQPLKAPCTASPGSAEATTPDGHEVWEVCTPFPSQSATAAPQTLYVSEDGGKTWVQRPSFPQPGMTSVVSTHPHFALTTATAETFATRDSGVTWAPLMTSSLDFATIRFVGSLWGWALDVDRNLWTSTDGGETWVQAGALPSTLG